MKNKYLVSSILILLFLGTIPTSHLYSKNNKYLFYLHGAFIEKYGKNKPNPQYGYYQYDGIVEYFTNNGFTVISEARSGEINIETYARKVANQIQSLINQGIPPENITVIGHSKGGMITLFISSFLDIPEINYVLMATCGKKDSRIRPKYDEFLSHYSSQLSGKILSICDSSDRLAGSCQEVFDKAKHVNSNEIILNTGKGHGIFYYSDPSWTTRILEWSKNE